MPYPPSELEYGYFSYIPMGITAENLARELWEDPQAAIGKRIRDNLKAPWREVA